MSEKVLEVQFADGSMWHIPARPLAEKRADYYATEVDGFPKGSPEWEAEVQHGLSDAYDLQDHVKNNMDWRDLEPTARRIREPRVYDYSLGWGDASAAIADAK